MSRSHKHTPITTFARSRSERYYKRLHSSRERIRARTLLSRGHYDQLDTVLVPWNEYVTSRDGKMYFNPNEHPRYMRK